MKNYQTLEGGLVACEEWTIFVNGGPDEGGKAVGLLVPLPACPIEKYDSYMQLLRDQSKQMVRDAARTHFGLTGEIRLRIARVKPTFVHESKIPEMQGTPKDQS